MEKEEGEEWSGCGVWEKKDAGGCNQEFSGVEEEREGERKMKGGMIWLRLLLNFQAWAALGRVTGACVMLPPRHQPARFNTRSSTPLPPASPRRRTVDFPPRGNDKKPEPKTKTSRSFPLRFLSGNSERMRGGSLDLSRGLLSRPAERRERGPPNVVRCFSSTFQVPRPPKEQPLPKERRAK